MKMKREKKVEKGITLIALIVTIIILMILAGVTLNIITGSEGILTKATDAIEENEKAMAKEQVTLKIQEYQI